MEEEHVRGVVRDETSGGRVRELRDLSLSSLSLSEPRPFLFPNFLKFPSFLLLPLRVARGIKSHAKLRATRQRWL